MSRASLRITPIWVAESGGSPKEPPGEAHGHLHEKGVHLFGAGLIDALDAAEFLDQVAFSVVAGNHQLFAHGQVQLFRHFHTDDHLAGVVVGQVFAFDQVAGKG